MLKCTLLYVYSISLHLYVTILMLPLEQCLIYKLYVIIFSLGSDFMHLDYLILSVKQ